ncbi:DNA translocase FtsK [Methylobacterium sp. ID0610]|uniref:DNA translocase FtsK n=1 Tax=Methylobacterium carpenticola TaxID=3344827 RepID=UPI003677CC37
MRGATPPAARRGLSLAALAETLMRIRALIARHLSPQMPQRLALPPPPRPVALDRRATPSWMSEPAPQPAVPAWTPDLVRAEPPSPEPVWQAPPPPEPVWQPPVPVVEPAPVPPPVPVQTAPVPPVAAPRAPAPRPPEPPRPAGPGPDAGEAWLAIPPAGPARTVLTRARRPADEVRPAPRPERSPDVTDLRFTRTPDHVLQARRRKREEEARAREAERLAAEEHAAAERAAREAAAEAERLAAEAAAVPPLPRWRQPYVLPPGVRFTRTPDHLLRHAPDETPPPAPPALAPDEAESAAAPAAVTDAPAEADAPALIATDASPVTSDPAPAIDRPSEPAEPAVSQDAAESAAPVVEAAEAAEASVAEEPAGPILLPRDITHLRALPKRPLYALGGLLKHDWTQPLAVAEVQDNRPVAGEETAAAEPETILPADPEPAVPVASNDAAPEAAAAAEPIAATAPVIEPAAPDDVSPDAGEAGAAPAAADAEPAQPAVIGQMAIPAAEPMAVDAARAPAEPDVRPVAEPAEARAVAPEPAAFVTVPAPQPEAGLDLPLVPLALTMVPVGPVEPIPATRSVEPDAAPPLPVVLPPAVATAPAAEPEPEPEPTPAPAETHTVVIGNAGLDSDLGLDAEDADDDEDIIALVPLPPRPQARASETPYEFPPLELLTEARASDGSSLDADVLQANAVQLQQVIHDFGVRGEILAVRPGPVVTLYEMEPAPGTKSSRVISLADDIARSMSAISARVAVVQGRNAIGIELPNVKRETVYLREILSSPAFAETKQKLALCLGKNIGGEAIIADLARMPHLLVAGTTGSGKSVAINTMILSLLYRMKPEECRLIMVDPKMLELSVYDGIPHLLSPVVTDPKKAVIALKWAVREMEERYKKMARLGVRNIDGFNARVAEARERGEVITRTVQTGFDRETGEAVYEDEVMDLGALPYIVVIVDEMADLMMVAGKDIEGAIQRLAQMARAAGIHLIMATQRPSVDVITGTIKANFPTRISFQVTSKIDSRTILGEMGAEQLLGQGDMLFMAGGGRTTRVHGPFVSDDEVEAIVAHLKRQGRPAYLDAVTADEEEAEAAPADAPVFDQGSFADPAADLYDQAVAVVLRDKKASTSYIQRRLQIGYNRAASLMERMEREGIVGPANHAGKREILVEAPAAPVAEDE